MTWSSREDVIKGVRNYFSELQEPELMQKSSNMQKELRFFCSCYRRKDEISSEKKHYNRIYLEASSATPQKRGAPLERAMLKIKKTLGCDFQIVLKKQSSGRWSVCKVAGTHDIRCHQVNPRVDKELRLWATKLLKSNLDASQVMTFWKEQNRGEGHYANFLKGIFKVACNTLNKYHATNLLYLYHIIYQFLCK